MSDSTAKSANASLSPFGRPILAVGAILFLHGAYSTYEAISVQKAFGVTKAEIPFDIQLQTIVAAIVILFGTMLTASPLRNITWASEYQKRTIDQVDARPSFVRFNHRGAYIFGSRG